MEFDAITKADRVIRTGEKIIVVDAAEDGVLIVGPKDFTEKMKLLKIIKGRSEHYAIDRKQCFTCYRG